MITEDYVSFEVAKLLKEKGFQAKCTACYHSDPSHTFELVSGRINYCNPRFSKCKMIPPYNAPTLQMAMKWLREVHNIYIEITPSSKTNEFIVDSYRIDIVTKTFDTIYVSSGYDTYEQACEAAIKYCLENLI